MKMLDARGVMPDDEIRARLALEIAREKEHGFQYWPLFAGAETFVGCCGLKPREPEKKIVELGFHLGADHWGKGYATEAGRAVIEHAWSVVGASAIFAGHHPQNEGSRRALEKLGFVKTHDELYPPTGLIHPGYLLSRP